MVPNLIQKIGILKEQDKENADILISIVEKTAIDRAMAHKMSMRREVKRREDAVAFAKKEEIQKQIETQARRKRRAELREKLRIETLQNTIMTNGIQIASKQDFKHDFVFVDVGD